LLPYLNLALIEINENTYRCSNKNCPTAIEIDGVSLADLPEFAVLKEQVVLLTRTIRLGLNNYIEVLNGQGNCTIDGIFAPSFKVLNKGQPILQCFFYKIKEGL